MRRIIYDYDSPHIVGREKRSFSIAKIIIGIIIVALIISLVYILFFRKERVKYHCKEYFTVVSGEFPDKTSAQASAKEISARGGAGFINEDETFEVVVSVYMSEADALEVAGRYGYMAKSTGRYAVELEADDAASIEFFSMPETLIDGIYKISVSLDKEEISLPAAIHALSSYKDAFADAETMLDKTNFSSLWSDKLSRCGEMIEEMCDELDKVDSISDRSQLKYCLCRVTFIYINLLKAIS